MLKSKSIVWVVLASLMFSAIGRVVAETENQSKKCHQIEQRMLSEEEIQAFDEMQSEEAGEIVMGDDTEILAAIGVFFIVLILCAAAASSGTA